MAFWEFANPNRFSRLVGHVVPYCTTLATSLLVIGIAWGFFFTPDDYRQGSAVKIIFVHVPSAMMAINMWIVMLFASLVWLVRRHRVSALAAKAAAPVGAFMTAIALITGAVWGKPIWGTWWAWDPRLASFLILFAFYVAYVTLWATYENSETASDLTSLLCLVGSVFAVLSRYAVNIWSQGLHQPATLSLDRGSNIHNAYYFPLVACVAGFALLSITLVLVRTRTEIRKHKIKILRSEEFSV